MNIEINPYNNTDFMLGSLYHHIMADGKKREGNFKNDQDALDMLKYNAA